VRIGVPVNALFRRAVPVLTLGLGLALLRPPEGRPQAAGQKPVFPAETELVIVDVVVSDKALFRFDASGEMVLAGLHPGVSAEEVQAATGWPLKVADRLEHTDPPTPAELATLRRIDPSRIFLDRGA